MTAAPLPTDLARMRAHPRSAELIPREMPMPLLSIAESPSGVDVTLGSVIQAIGTPQFDVVTLSALYEHAGVEHFATFKVLEDDLAILGAGSIRGSIGCNQGLKYIDNGLWRSDPTIARAHRALEECQTAVLDVRISELPPELRDLYGDQQVCDRRFVCGKRSGGRFAISMLKTTARGLFEEPEMAWIKEASDILISALCRHAELSGSRSTSELPPIHEIETRLRRHEASLTKRETQVCARILRGVLAAGIATELGVSEESIVTYRKRAYARLSISTRFELLSVFLRLPSGLTRPPQRGR